MTAAFPGIRDQTFLDDLLDFSGTIAAGGTAQLLLPQQPERMSIIITNNSAADTLFLGIGPGKATASLAAGAISGIAVNNGGVGYTVTPLVSILGGIVNGDYETTPGSTRGPGGAVFVGRIAQAHAVLTAGVITSVVIDDPGAGYLVAPTIYFNNPWPQLGAGAFAPTATATATGTGIAIPTGQSFTFNGALIVPGSAIAINGFTTGDAFSCKVGGLI